MLKLHSTSFEGMELIRLMYLIREEDDTCTICRPDGSGISKRMEVKQLIAERKKVNPFVEGNIFKSVENVNPDTVIEYKKQEKRYHFLDQYEKKGEEG